MILKEAANRILELQWSSIPEIVRQTAVLGILDTVGVSLAGAYSPSVKAVWRAIAPSVGTGRALILGTRRFVDPLNASLVNGVASHALDFDDCSNTLGGHPSAPILPALWALAETGCADGRRLLECYVAGVELETRIGRAVNFTHYEKGWHPTATLGTFGSAAACGKLMNLELNQMTAALAIAASMASGIKANFGTMTKPFHVGHATRNGLLAAMLAREGLSANPEALEHQQGFFAVFNGWDHVAPDRVLEGWADPLDLFEPGLAFKRHPCCASTHPAIDALLRLRAEHRLKPENVAKVESWTHPRRFRHTNRPDPASGLDGKFSVQYTLARALIHGSVSLDHFAEAAVHDPSVRDVMSRIKAMSDPDATMATAEHFYARVRVTTVAGETMEAFIDRPLGRDRDHPLPEGTLEAKFRDCAAQAVGADAADEVLRLLLELDTCPDVGRISAVLANATSDERDFTSQAGQGRKAWP